MKITSTNLQSSGLMAATKQKMPPTTPAAPEDSVTFSDSGRTGTRAMLAVAAGIMGAGAGATPFLGSFSNTALFAGHGWSRIDSLYDSEKRAMHGVGAGISLAGSLANLGGLLLSVSSDPNLQLIKFGLLGLSGLAGGVSAYSLAAG